MKKPINALLLSAGLGTRLKPLTLAIPKCLVEINNKPILEEWIDKLIKLNAKKILINTHYKAEKVDIFLNTQINKKVSLFKYHEEELMGTAGTLIANYEFFKSSTGILIHVDNYTQIDLSEILLAHQKRPKCCLLTMLTFNTKNPENCGIVKVNDQGIVQDFFEKESKYNGNIANGAVYLFDYNFLEWLVENYPKAKDFSTEIIPNLIGKIFTSHTNMTYIDIGTPEELNKARNLI